VRKPVSAEMLGITVDDEDLNGYLMYPKVFLDYMGRHKIYGPVRTLPTPTFFYGMQPGDEISLEIDPGKTLEIRLQAVGETDRGWRGQGLLRTERPAPRHPGAEPGDQGEDSREAQGRRGQPRPCRRADAGGGRLDCGDGRPEGARGRSAAEHRGDEDGNRPACDREATVKAIHVHPGSQIEAKDLLIELE
jgi:pyruvate carboxylase